jgi:probable phosphoglycerate mutase
VRRLYVVTHPESAHHVTGLVGGWHDSDLTARGREQADRIAIRIRELVPAGASAEVWSSDLRRATGTAGPVAALLGVGPRLLSGLREKSYGVAEGRPQAWLDERFVPPPATGDRMDHDEGVDGAETRRAFASRVYAALEEVLASGAAHQVVVTHGFALTFLVAAWIRMPVASTGYVNLRAPGGSITVLEEDDYFHNRAVVALADTAHLAG